MTPLVLHDAPAGGPDIWTMLGGLGLFFAVMYLLVLRPKQQEDAAASSMLASLAKDDQVVTSSGIHGRIVEIMQDVVLLEVSEKTRIRIDRSAIARKAGMPAGKT